MRITWLFDPLPGAELEDPSGLQADALAARGHEVRIITAERPPALFGGKRAEWVELDDWRVVELAGDDFVVATSPQTLRLARDLAGRRAIVLEGATIVAEEIFQSPAPRQRERLRVLLAGPSQSEARGIDEGYGAVAHARWFHQKLELVRVSPWAPSREEPLDSIDEFHVGLDGAELTRLLHSCDAAIVPSRSDETAVFPAAAALAAGLPSVVTDIPLHRFTPERDYAHFAPERNAVEQGEKLIELLTDEALRSRLRTRGAEIARRWHPDTAGERLEKLLEQIGS
ncbi:MAG TPA: glycosyltransferase [Thermoanaerobaculia bacterium]|nr:glycosyltransferase [Thermoanaerobaculia bacterium]